jgi:hypothetical protein
MKNKGERSAYKKYSQYLDPYQILRLTPKSSNSIEVLYSSLISDKAFFKKNVFPIKDVSSINSVENP